MTTLSLKRGDTFAVLCQRVDSTGAAINVTDLTVSSEIRAGAFSDTLTVTKVAGVDGKFWLSATPAATALWPVSGPGLIKTQFDVQFDDGDTVISSDTVTVSVGLDMTQVASAVTGLPTDGDVAVIFKDRTLISGSAGVGQTLEAAVLYRGPAGPSTAEAEAAAAAAAASAAAAATTAGNVNTALAQTQAARDAALGYDNEAKAARDAAQGYAGDAASAVVYQNLAAIADSHATTVVAAIIYDTSLDSDGGEAIRNARGSWYYETLNTATRGATRGFPAKVKIEATASAVTIYDATDPALPMWRVHTLTGLTITSVSARDGHIVVGTTTGVVTINFPADKMRVAPNYTTSTSPAIVNASVNSVAITTLPGAPVDPATGLPVPTIAVGTAGGVSVIKDDGTVVNSSTSTSSYLGVSVIGPDLWGVTGTNQAHQFKNLATLGAGFTPGYITTGTSPAILPGTTKLAHGYHAFGGASGVTKLSGGQTIGSVGMAAYLTSTFLTGWMVGAIKGAWLASSDATSLVASGELVTNGTFATDVSGWLAFGATIAWSSGQIAVTGNAGQLAYQNFTTIPGRTYRVSGDIVSGASASISAFNGVGYGTGIPLGTTGNIGPASASFAFTATGTSTAVRLTISSGTGVTVNFDNISCQLADADRSVNNNGLIVNGTVTRAPVATGASLVGYSGFSATNYLSQPYNPALNFGTGDFCVMGWVYLTTTASQTIFDRGNSDGVTSSNRIAITHSSTTGYQFYTKGATNIVAASVGANAATGKWSHVCAVRSGTTHLLYVDGAVAASTTNTAQDLTNTASRSIVGASFALSTPFLGSLALLRIGATAPTANQIAKIYRDELPLFQPGATGLLLQDAVTALAHDPVTGLDYVGQGSLGSATFKGLLRVETDATPVTTAISAVNGMVVSQ